MAAAVRELEASVDGDRRVAGEEEVGRVPYVTRSDGNPGRRQIMRSGAGRAQSPWQSCRSAKSSDESEERTDARAEDRPDDDEDPEKVDHGRRRDEQPSAPRGCS